MRHTVTIMLLGLILPVAAFAAKDRIVEKSGKTPDWIMSAGNGSFSVFAEADDISSAREKCLSDIRQYIINSVASNIESVEKSSSGSHNENGQEDIWSAYSSELKTVAARLPFITGISLSGASDIYWEKYRRGSDRSYYYRYYVLYPFTEYEKNRMIRKFLEYDGEKYAALTELKEAYGTLTDVSGIDAGIRDLEPLMEYFFDDVRKKEAESLMKAYREAYSKISLVPLESAPGRFSYCLMLDGRRMTCSRMPALRSETAVSLELRPEGDSYVLTFDDSLCYPADDNNILISYSFPGASLKYRYQFDVSGRDSALQPSGVITVRLSPVSDSLCRADVSMNIRSRTEDRVEVTGIWLSILPGLEVDQELQSVLEGEGTHLLSFSMETVPVDRKYEGRGMVSGTIGFLSDGKKDKLTFTLPYNLIIY